MNDRHFQDRIGVLKFRIVHIFFQIGKIVDYFLVILRRRVDNLARLCVHNYSAGKFSHVSGFWLDDMMNLNDVVHGYETVFPHKRKSFQHGLAIIQDFL